MLFNLIGFQSISQKGWITLREFDFSFWDILYVFICCSPYIVNESNLGLVFCGKALILSLNFTIINIYFVFYQKKKKRIR